MIANNIKLIVYPAKDMEKAKSLFTAFLGIAPYVDSPYYTGFRLGDLEVGLDPSSQGVVSYVDVIDIKKSLKTLLEAGAVVEQDVKEVGGGLLIAQIKDTNGNILGLRQESQQQK